MSKAKKKPNNSGKVSGKGTGRQLRPENLTPWKKGQSGNPKGCPPKAERLSEILKEHLETLAPEEKEGAPARPWKTLFVEAVVKAAIKGNGTAIKEVFDRIDGKVPLPLKLGVTPGEALPIVSVPKEVCDAMEAALIKFDRKPVGKFKE